MSRKTLPEGISFVQKKGDISEFKLDSNGLRVLHRHDGISPVALVMMTYHVGSRNESVGVTGATHMLEHLLFKGSTNFNKQNGKLGDVLLSNAGALLNATTWMDRTNYFCVVPSNMFETALAIEADRVRGALFSDDDRKSEMTVVRNEYERYKNDPASQLDEEVWATAFLAHPYHHPTIGWKSDIENIPTGRLRDFYDTFYWPNNATLTLMGDVSEVDALKLVKKYFSSIPRSTHEIPKTYTVEPPQEGPRHVEVHRKEQPVNLVTLAYKTPEGLHKDAAALAILEYVLYFSKLARLYAKLVEPGLVSDISVHASQFHDPSLFIINLTLTKKLSHEKAADLVRKELQRIARKGITKDELQRARRHTLTSFGFLRDGLYQEASVINECIAIGDWSYYTRVLADLEKVTRADVQRVVERYFKPEHETTGFFVGSKK